ncbi:hypothetical protein BAUCODRAFT_78849 [Baudoinia panamericana UAMH 10762]|uniref:non-specific serine/threonine protein kinase n=1 Tax=Baudoinia panamericana (strain UAMH 10762) TaxID=717646 RepID=M2MZ10_BAUPA|nr:uncharacterized protein BAUCODRAFT_78849 [Baudoinia panamericana UAMH 10762]EMC91545.1 hypothetical protein BAUCODRAFT_78849 [Baudoinia panamericana UAMH 10762]
MGQGYSTTLPTGPNALESAESPDLIFEKPLGGTRFLRTVRARHQAGVVVAKVCVKANPNISFKQYARALRQERQALADIPNVLPYQRIRETSTVGLLVRQYVHSSLYDRISIRPFLETIEKKWIAFQLLCAVRDCHARGVFHGDIKSENVVVTSWGWVYLTDFAATFKPVYLPEDNPADFSFYYDTSTRRTCYIAPERFLAAGDQQREDNEVQWNMDIFSLGCVLAELFTETPTFTLSQLFRYRKGEYDPTVSLLNKIDDDHVRALIASMIRLNPEDRWHAQDYLDEYRSKAFPLYFYQHLHVLMQELTDPTSGRTSVAPREKNNGIADDRIDRVYEDFEMLAVSLGYTSPNSPSEVAPTSSVGGLFPLHIDLPNNRHTANPSLIPRGENGTFILLNVITSSVRSAGRASSKIRACELLLAFAERVPDEAKLDRILPYGMPLLDDADTMVLVAALRTMTQLLALVTVASPVNSFVFTQYIFPRLQAFVNTKNFKEKPIVRANYAACLASLAETASRFLDMMQALRAEGSLPSAGKDAEDGTDEYAAYHDAYDTTRLEVLEAFEAQTKVFVTDNDTAVRRAFLRSVPSLCVFFGEARASDIILSHLNTYLNDPDWQLKCAFFRTIVGVAVYVGSAGLEEFILPLMLQALADPQEFVVEQALRSLASMAEIGLLQRPKTWELIDTIARFELHPNAWVREAASHFVSAATTHLSVADVRILVSPLVQPYLKVPLSTASESELLDALKKPLPRTVLDLALDWAKRVDKGVFWKSAKESKQLSYRGVAQMPPTSSVADLGSKVMSRLPKTDEDEQWLGQLRNAGMRNEDEMKLLAFREYLWRAAQRMKKSADPTTDNAYEQIVQLSKHGLTPQTVIFDNSVEKYEQRMQDQIHADKTIAEALQEATDANAGTVMKQLSAPPDVATDDATAAGRLDTPFVGSRRTSPRPHRPNRLERAASQQVVHNYAGNDPTILKLLDAVYVENFPADAAEFGPLIQSPRRGPILNANTVPNTDSKAKQTTWKPEGVLVAVLGEHTDCVTRIVVAPDHVFFLTGSDDCSVKVWDSGRLERNVTHRSRLTYRIGQGVKITSLCFVESTHTFVCTGSDGSVHVVKVECSEVNESVKYGRPRTLRRWQLPTSSPGEYAVWSEHYRGESASTLMLATNLGRILAVDLRYMTVIYDLLNPPQHGTPTCFCLSKRQEWLLVGTAYGVLDLWDLRFRLRLRSWAFPSATAITRLQLHPSRKSAKRNRVCVAGGTANGEVTVWDVEKVICHEVYRPAVTQATDRLHLRDYELRNLEDERSDGLLSRIARAGASDAKLTDPTAVAPVVTSSLFFGLHHTSNDAEAAHAFALTGGPDNKVRFWECDRVEGCRVVSGALPEDKPPTYTYSQLGLDTRVLSENIAETDHANAATSSVSAAESNKSAPNTSPKRTGTGPKVAGKPSRYETIRTSAQHLLGGHLDAITDVALLERPFGMVISADRLGQVFVHQ